MKVAIVVALTLTLAAVYATPVHPYAQREAQFDPFLQIDPQMDPDPPASTAPPDDTDAQGRQLISYGLGKLAEIAAGASKGAIDGALDAFVEGGVLGLGSGYGYPG